MRIESPERINVFESIIVQEELRRQGHDDWVMRPGNGCVWVSVPRAGFSLEMYYIFQDGKLTDVHID